jgi:hypothetical protein
LIVFLNIPAISIATNSAQISNVSLSALAFISGLKIVLSVEDLLSKLPFLLECDDFYSSTELLLLG